MLTVTLRPVRENGYEAVDITRPGTNFRASEPSRRMAVTWLTNHGCCPGAAAILFDIEPGSVCEIAEPLDLPRSRAPA